MRTIVVDPDNGAMGVTLPPSEVGWEIEPDRAALLVHDMQDYFLTPFPGHARDRLRNHSVQLVGACRRAAVPIARSGQSGLMTVRDRGLMADFWGPGMGPDAAERRWADGLCPSPDDLLLTKTRYSAFHATPLLSWMRRSGRDQLIVCGVYTHVGILSTALDAFTHDIQPFLVADAMADMSPVLHHSALTQAARTCARVVTTDTALHALGAPSMLEATDRPDA